MAWRPGHNGGNPRFSGGPPPIPQHNLRYPYPSTSGPPYEAVQHVPQPTPSEVVAPRELFIDEPILKTFRVSRTFSENSASVNSIDFSPHGDLLLTSGDDDIIAVFDCLKGSVQRIINSKTYGVENITYSHSPSAALHSCTKVDDRIRYLNLQENKYISTFAGHSRKVVQLVLSPVDDQFMSSSMDKTVRIWDHRQAGCVGLLQNLDSSPIVAYDPEGLVFAAGACIDHEQRIMLYDIRSYTDGPFTVFRYPEERDCDWCYMKISPNGRYMLIGTNGMQVYILDSFTGVCLFVLKGHVNRGFPLEACFTPDNNFVVVGSYDGKLHLWNLKSGQLVVSLSRKQMDSAMKVKFAPVNMLIASAGTKVSFWLPFLGHMPKGPR